MDTAFLMNASNMPGELRSLPGDARLRLRFDACLVAQSLPQVCNYCVSNCPSQALRLSGDGPILDGDCLGCGRCAAACPTGALQVEGFDETELLLNRNQFYRVECWKVPGAITGDQAIRVPCFGGIGLEQLLEWVEAAGDRPLAIADRGWCAGCTAGSDRNPIEGLLAAAEALLTECGWPEALLPRKVFGPLPIRLMPADIPQPVAELRASLSGLFSRGSAQTVVSSPVTPTMRRPVNSCAVPKRDRLLAVAQRLAAQRGRPAPASLYPSLRVSDQCRGLGACVAFCPPGALRCYEEDGWSGVEFDAGACLGCGLCMQACRDGALSVAPRSESASLGWQRLTRFPLRNCDACGKSFVALGEQSACPGCRLTRQAGLNFFQT